MEQDTSTTMIRVGDTILDLSRVYFIQLRSPWSEHLQEKTMIMMKNHEGNMYLQFDSEEDARYAFTQLELIVNATQADEMIVLPHRLLV